MIDEAGAAQKILPKSKQKKTIGKDRDRGNRRQDRIPAKNVSSDDRNSLKTLDRDLKEPYLVRTRPSMPWRRPSKCPRSQLNNPDKPIGSFLFSGPTGVGKTEARQLAYCPGVELLRF